MASRREFIQAGIAASVLPMIVSAREISRQPLFGARSFYKVIFDQRFPASVAFAREMTQLGATVHAIDGDITDLWFHDLHTVWTKQPVAIAGLTAHGPLFCLERLAWDHGMRVTFRAEHPLADVDAEPLYSWIIATGQERL
jgi:hypothetical protein